jgi:hypothetical protein
MAKTVFDVLREKLQESVDSCEESLVSGAAKDYAQYREICGVIRGLTTAIRELQDLSRNYMEDEDD